MTDEPMSGHLSTLGMRPERVVEVLGERTRVIEALDQAFRWSHRTSVLETSTSRVAELLNCEFDWSNAEPTTEAMDPAILAFVEQWVIDVASMSEATLTKARDLLGADGLMDFIHSLLVIEQRVRLDLAWQCLGLGPVVEGGAAVDASHLDHWGALRASDEASTPPASAGARPGDRRLSAALNEWQAAVVCLDDVDPVTTELVRLRCANYHDCLT